MSGVVRISEELLPLIDNLIENTPKDDFGIPKYKTRVDVVDDAIKELLKKYGVKPKQRASA